MFKIIAPIMASCFIINAAAAQEEKKVVIVKKMDTTIVHGKESGPQKMTVIIENGKVTINGKPVDGVNLPELMGSVPGIPKVTNMPKVMMFKSDDMNTPLPKLDGKVGELKIVKGMPLDMSQLGENIALSLFNDGPKMGISIEDVAEGSGAKVLEVTEGSPAAKAGIAKNDIITSIDGKEIKDVTALQEIAATMEAGNTLSVKLTRDGKSKDVSVKIPKKVKKANI
jgi:membrane-associated protease RseP (regulator of RpoE activity)